MITYREDGDVGIVDGHSFRKDKSTGYFLSAGKIDGKRKRLHVYVWEKYNGTVPKGYQVHHIDENKKNNEINNLEALTAYQHQHLHAEERIKREPEAFERFHRAGIEAAPKWHKSKVGIEWHKKHYEKYGTAMYVKHEVRCKNCGKSFETTAYKENYYCCNACKSAYRRKIGVDDETRKCTVCGKEFRTNKYSKAKYCSRRCASVYRRTNKKNTENWQS